MTTALTLRDVLFATDFSQASERAGQTAAAMARHFGARLHVLHVVPPVTDPAPGSAALRAAAGKVETGISVIPAIATGRAASEILSYARRNTIGLIVLGTHGRTGFSRALLGSVAEAVTRRAGCPVLTVPAAPATAPSPMAADEIKEPTSCAVCGASSQDDLVCESCRGRIRGEALERKWSEERAGRR